MEQSKMCIFLHAEDLLWICIRDIILSVQNPAVMDAQWIPAREFALTPPKKLGKDSLLIICSHSGKTKECLEAAKTGMDAGAAVVTMTHAPGSPCDTDKWISVVYDWAPGVKEAEKPQGIVLRILNELMKVQEPGI